MLNVLLGIDDKSKSEYIKGQIKDMLNEDVVLIVTEQSSFQSEKEILEFMGEKRANEIEVISFTRLCNLIFKKTGFPKGKRIDDITKNILIHLCFEELKDVIKIYSGYANNIEIINMIKDIFSEFKKCAVSAEDTADITEKFKNSELGEKMKEIAMFYGVYESLISKEYFDPLDDLEILHNKLLENPFFVGKTVFIDSFWGFTVQEMNIIKLILIQAKNVFISFPSEDEKIKDNGELFSLTKSTIREIERFAREEDIGVKKIYCKDIKRNSNELKNLALNIFRNNNFIFKNSPNDIHIYNAEDCYDEINYVAGKISEAIEEHGYKYKDFAVILRDEETYGRILENIFDKYDISYFIDRHKKIDTSPLMSLVLSLFDIIINRYKTEDIMRYLKTGLTRINQEKTSILENYAFLWGIDKEKWFKDFTNNPRGFSEKFSNKDKEKLKQINEIRSEMIEPVLILEKKLKFDETGDKKVKDLYIFLEKTGVKKALQKYVNLLKSIGCEIQAKEELRLWGLLVEILDKVYDTLKNRKVSVSEFAKILGIAISTQEIASIPQSLDQTDIVSAQRSGVVNAKIAFTIGANENDFPKNMSNSGLLTDFQREKLIDAGFGIKSTLERLSAEEEFLAYKAVCVPSEKLYISFVSENLKSEPKTESVIVREVKKIFPELHIETLKNQDKFDFIRKIKPSFEILAKHWKEDNKVYNTLKDYYKNNPEYSDMMMKLENASGDRSLNFRYSENASEFFGKYLKISASQIEKFYRCKFSYFCRYGLNVKERKKAEVDALEYGSMIHYILENIFKNNDITILASLSHSKIKDKVELLLEKYIDNKLAGIDKEDKRILFHFKRWVYTATLIVKNMVEEISQNDFIPTDFELAIAHGGDIEALEIKGDLGVKTVIEGKIDRVDILSKDENTYFRIIDYKTGTKNFNFSDILYGINIQMLLYMTAIAENGEKQYKNALPAGVLYINVKRPVEELERSGKKVNKKKSGIQGIVLNSAEVIDGMDKERKGEFLPLSYDKYGKPKSNKDLETVNSYEMNMIKNKIKDLVSDMSKELCQGNIKAVPLKEEGQNKFDSCKWCEYKSVCGYEDGMEKISIVKLKREKIIEKLKADKEGGINE